MSYKSYAANECLLSYGITTNPDPLQASPTVGNPSITSLVVTVSNNTAKPIYCNQLTFSFPIGTLAQDLTAVSTGILVAANPSNKWQIAVTADGVFTATPITPNYNSITADGLSFQIYNIQPNDQVGTFTFSIQENSSTNDITFTKKNNLYDLAKFPYGFYVTNFAASMPMVGNGIPVTLTWSGSDLAAYTILYNTSSVDVTNARIWSSPPLNNTTTFALMATLQENGETVYTYLYVTVIVANPELTVSTLNVLQGSTLAGDAVFDASLNVAGKATFTNLSAHGSVGVTGDIEATGALKVSGAALMNTIDVDGQLSVTGNATLNNTQISGTLSVNSTVSMLKDDIILASGTYISQQVMTAKTDGFVMSYIEWPSDVVKRSNAYASIYSSGINSAGHWFEDMGGSVGTFSKDWDRAMVRSPSTMCVPVAANTIFSFKGSQSEDNQLDSNITFYWYPIGAVAAGESTFEIVSDDEYTIPTPPTPPLPTSQDRNELLELRKVKAEKFIDQLVEMLTKPTDKKRNKTLVDLLVDLS